MHHTTALKVTAIDDRTRQYELVGKDLFGAPDKMYTSWTGRCLEHYTDDAEVIDEFERQLYKIPGVVGARAQRAFKPYGLSVRLTCVHMTVILKEDADIERVDEGVNREFANWLDFMELPFYAEGMDLTPPPRVRIMQ